MQEDPMPKPQDLTFLRPTMLGLAATAVLALSACGGGSDSDGNDASSNPPTQNLTTGTVAVLMTDAPTDAFCRIYATVERIDLLGTSGSPTNVFVGPETVDLLAMRNYTDFFSIDTAVPIGSYEKVRLTLSDLALVECDDAGNPESEAGWDHPRLPGNGKMDLNPRGMFEVVGGETLVIELDVDMNKSLHVHQTGNGRWQFRPVIFVAISPDDSKLVRVFGEVRNLGATTFELCPVAPASSIDPDPADPAPECIDVATDASTGIFDETGSPVGLSAVANGDLLTAIGFLSLHDDMDGDTRMDDLLLNAAVLELGPIDTFARIRGAVVSAPGNNDLFEFDGAPLDPATGVFDVLLQSGTRIFALGSNDELTSAALQPGTEGEVDGVFTDPPTSGEPLKSSLIVLDQDTTPEVSILDAKIATIPADDDPTTPETRRILVDTTALSGQCVTTDAATRYLLVTESATASETTEIAFADLAVGNDVDVYGTTDPSQAGCVLADTIQKFASAP
jgi:hypothetical protein